MSYPLEILAPTLTEPWVGDRGVDIPDIPNIGIDTSCYKYVSQGHSKAASSDEGLSHLGSDGFSFVAV